MDLVGNDHATGCRLRKAYELIACEYCATGILWVAEIEQPRLWRVCAAQGVEVEHPASVLQYERDFGMGAGCELERVLEMLVERRRQKRVLVRGHEPPRAHMQAGHDAG